MKTIQDFYGLQSPNEWFPYGTKLNSPKSVLFGIELELENVRDPSAWITSDLFMHHSDGSLRNNGREFITYPICIELLEPLLLTFFKSNKINERNISERCSVHVHANCLNISWDTLRSILLLYQCFEGLLFAFAGADRDKSIFCVPWNQTNLGKDLLCYDSPTLPVQKWQKYTALNLRRLADLGTIEFRHLPGTTDPSKIITWLNLINCLFVAATTTEFKTLKDKILNLNTTSAYRITTEEIFKEFTPILLNNDYERILEDDVLGVKYLLINENTIKKDIKKKEKAFNTLIWDELQTAAFQQPVGELRAVNIFDDLQPRNE